MTHRSLLQFSGLSRSCLSRHISRYLYPIVQRCMVLARYYSAKSPVYKKSGNFLVNALNYVKDVEKYQDELSKGASEKRLAEELLERITDYPELLFLLLLFHSELSKVGITATSSRTFTGAQIWRYRTLYIMKLAKIHDIFWTQCQYLNISEREHKLGFLPSHIGVLDPINFEESSYEALQLGVYKGTDFTDIEMLGVERFK